jgi:4-amino-4-deoxy-L-arabinose transferase-like glycosyltransferase
MTMDSWKQLAIVAAVCAWFSFWGIGSVSFIDPDEGMYGTIAGEMAEGGDWVTLHFNGVRYLNKPPLLFWLSALTFKITGPSEWGVRLWSALPAFGAALLVWFMGTWLYGASGGLFSALIFSFTVGIFLYSHVTLTDLLLVFSVSLAVTAAMQSLRAGDPKGRLDGQRNRWEAGAPLFFYLALALGALAKGLVAILLPAAIIGIFALICGRVGAVYRSLVANRYALTGIVLFFIFVAPWHILAIRENPGFFRYYLLDNQLLRYVKGGSLIEDDVSVTTSAFLLLSLVWFLPWSLLLPVVVRGLFRIDRAPSPARELRLLPPLWALTVLIFFSFSSSKLEHYSLPALPALSLMTGGWWAARLELTQPVAKLSRYAAFALLIIAMAGIAMLHSGFAPTTSKLSNAFSGIMGYYRAMQAQGHTIPIAAESFFTMSVGVGLTVILGVSAAALLLTFNRVYAAFFAFLLTSAGIFILLFRLLLLLEPYHSSKPIAEAILPRLQPHDLVLHEDPLEYSGGLAYYTGRRIYVINGKRGSLEFGSRYPEARDLFLDTEMFRRLWAGERKLFLVTGLPRERSAVRLLPQQEVVLVGQFGARWLYTNRP